MTVNGILLRRAILEWRDTCLFEAEVTLTRLVRDLEPLIAEPAQKASVLALTVQPGAFSTRVVEPMLARRLDPAIKKLSVAAQEALRAVGNEPFAVNLVKSQVGAQRDLLAAALDIGSAGAPVALGVWALFTATGASVGSVAIFLGLGATATVSLPILAGGAIVAAIAGTFAVSRMSGLKARGAQRLERQVAASVRAAVLGTAVQEAPSVLSAYTAEVERVTAAVIRGAKDGTDVSV